MEYINKKWDLPTMEKKLSNLKKIIPELVVNLEIDTYTSLAENRLDALYLAYYSLKDKYCKVKRSNFGKPKTVEFESKKTTIDGTGSYYWWSPSNYTWTVSTNANYTNTIYSNYSTFTTNTYF